MKTEIKFHGYRIFKYSFEGQYSKKIYGEMCQAIKVKSEEHHQEIGLALLNAIDTFEKLKDIETFNVFIKCKDYAVEITVSA